MRYLANFRGVLALLLALMGAGAAGAHPHIFVTTGLKLVLDDQGAMAGIEVTWEYDEFYSLLVLEDMALDDNHDGALTETELARLDGFDMNWVAGYAGDLFVRAGGSPVALGPPEPRGTMMREGRIVTRHFRPIHGGAPRGVVLRAYDPTYYTQYDLGLGVDLPKGCTVAIRPADLSAAQKTLKAELAKLSKNVESNYPEVGAVFADTVEVECAGGS